MARPHLYPAKLITFLLALGLWPAPGLAQPDSAETPEAAETDEGTLELEQMRAAEEAAVDVGAQRAAEMFKAWRRCGAANPASRRLEDALGSRALPIVPDEGEIEAASLAELGSFDIEKAKKLYDIPVLMHPLVAEYIHFFQTVGRMHFVKWLARSTRYLPMMRKTLREAGLPEDTVYLAMIESGFSAKALSRARAAGLWQFIEPTGRRFGLRVDFWIDQRRDPIRSTLAAAGYLRDLYGEFGDWPLAWAAYNAGENRLRGAVRALGTSDFWEIIQGSSLRRETKHYVPKLMAAALVAKHLKFFGFSESELQAQPPLEFDEGEVPEFTDLEVVARAAGTRVELIKELNPELKRWCTPPAQRKGEPYRIRLPAGSKQKFEASFSQIAPKERMTYRIHRVVRGDTLSKIATVHGSAAEAVMRVNGLRDSRRLRLGSELVIPIPGKGAVQSLAAEARRHGFKAVAPDQEIPAAIPAKKRAMAAGSVHTLREGGKTKILYGVADGDSLWSIGQRFRVGVSELRSWNGLRSALLRVGQQLVIYPSSAFQAAAKLTP
jgi:membrane-bound lytic murein transglycosylase D